MPVYEYECSACAHRFEEWQKMADAPIKKCPSCGEEKVERLISATSFTLKGGGWYSDLYASSKKGAASKEGSGGGDGGTKPKESAASTPAAATPASTDKKSTGSV